MPEHTLLAEVSFEDVSYLQDLFDRPDIAGTYAAAVGNDLSLSFSLGKEYGPEHDMADLVASLAYLSTAEEIPTSFKNRRKKKNKATKPMAEDIIEAAAYADNVAVFEAMEALHPQLLQLVDEHFIPPKGVSMFDQTHQANIARNLFLTTDPLVRAPDKPYTGNVLVRMGQDHVYVDPGGVELVRGTPIDVFAYVVDMDRAKAYKVYTQLCADEAIRKLLGGVDNYAALLRMFRYERGLARSLDKISKVSQLRRADADAPYFWFDDLHLDFLILHPNLPLQVKARYQRHQVAYLEDFVRFPQEAAYVVDVTRGGVEGASANDHQLVQQVESNCQYAYMHMYLELGLVGKPLVVVGKPRPHNHTAVFYYDKENEPFTLMEFETLLADIQLANEQRNQRLYGLYKTHPVYPMPPHNLVLDMVTYVRTLWQASDDVALTRRAKQATSKDKNERTRQAWKELEEHTYQELAETFSGLQLPAYKKMYAPHGYFVMTTKPLRCFVKGDVAKAIQYNIIMTETEGCRGYFFGEWWYIKHPDQTPKQRYVVRGVEERVYKQLSAPVPINSNGKKHPRCKK